MPCEHRAARDERGGNIHAHRAHEHSGDDLVAVAHEYARVEGVRRREDLRAVRNDLAGGEGIAHSLVSHGDAVAHADGRHDDGLPARRDDAFRDRARDLVKVRMPGDNVALRADDAHDGLLHFAVRPAQRPQKGALRRHIAAV